ncbi:hypothetical protein [Gallionella capsiferriformans]|uniref:Integrase family protein n=1 Tax=Gallionella capsiferriformans (strain ES-2) TaxID=395494 RepID=D9SDF4_GALCS|nr:hypothetical protein [Gallionella capsiferriformans]ADL56752.1 hypothetical protein Galf_2757 [Gallionella capsiferriformans ES-2]
MSIRNIKKDHLKEHASVELVTPVDLPPLPNHEDPLKFWTQHETENMLVDLTVFAKGELTRQRKGGSWVGSFTGRPQLILQMAPAIEKVTFGYVKGSVRQLINSMRCWWRLLDTVEQAATMVGQNMDRVEDVRLLSRVHLEFVHRSGMRTEMYYPFYRIVNATLKLHNSSGLHWHPPENPDPKRYLPPEDQVKSLRIALKQEWEKVRQCWAQSDLVCANGFKPQTEKESTIQKHWQHFVKIQESSGRALPTTDELREGKGKGVFLKSTGMGILKMRNIIFPSRWEVETAFHLCLANTGWNPAVLSSLDACNGYEDFLQDHPRDPDSYLLKGTKVRAGGKEQLVKGLWKTKAGPGFIIKTWLERVAPLREQLKTMLVTEKIRYSQMVNEGASADELTCQLNKIQKIEMGCRSVWLYVSQRGGIEWLRPNSSVGVRLNGKPVTYMAKLIDQINRERAILSEAPISVVAPSDFRDLFALYVWRRTGGNILTLMHTLNHAHLRTTQGYTENNILNAERDSQARTFLDHLFDELDKGRVDITILAHLQRHGAVSKEMEQRLTEFRAHQRSRMGMACKDPFHPPAGIQPESKKNRMCGSQRCLLCKSHAVILPESMTGIAMRVEELNTMRDVLPVGIWLESRFPEELRNGIDILRLFSPDEVLEARTHWAQAIDNGSHYIPGLHIINNLSEAT